MELQDRLTRKDTTKGPPLRVLSLDGGGVRGYSMLILLQELMYKTYNAAEGKPPKPGHIPKPCDYFDLIVGSGTGGLIAIMLGRLRLDIETCKEVYIRMTRRVFETDKTIVGIPYRSTLFKASKLEDAIRDCVAEHTLYGDEGNDGTSKGGIEMPVSSSGASISEPQRRQSFASSVRSGGDSFTPMSPSAGMRFPVARWRGNPNASLYDTRENRTKTAVTAVYKGTPQGGGSIFLRSYDSRAEPAPEFNCSIWQAGRATCAIGLAFKPIQIGQSMFHDDGAGAFNPTPQVIDECVLNEWPNRDIGALVSIGTGRRPTGTAHRQSEWWESFVGGTAGSFAEARRRLMHKIEECEKTHRFVRDEYLVKRGVDPDNYFRLNVEVGVGEFGMNEWSRLAEISTNTRMYLSQDETRRITQNAADRLGRIERMRRRLQSSHNAGAAEDRMRDSVQTFANQPLAVELPGDDGYVFEHAHRPLSQHATSQDDKFAIVGTDLTNAPYGGVNRQKMHIESQSQPDWGGNRPEFSGASSPRQSLEGNPNIRTHQAPPLPPKMPLVGEEPPPQHLTSRPRIAANQLPYPLDEDEAPPRVDMGKKPTLQR